MAPTSEARVEQHREGLCLPGDHPLTPAELTDITFGSFNPEDPVHQAVYESFETGQPLPITWKEALAIHIKVSNRNRLEPLASSTIYKYNKSIEFFAPYAEPAKTTPDIIRQFLDDHEEGYEETTVAQLFRCLSATYKSFIAAGNIKTHSPFDLVIYKASTPLEQQPRPYTDEEIRLINQEIPPLYQLCLAGLRVGEYFTREESDLNVQILRVDKKPNIAWRPKRPSSIRDVAVTPGFVLNYLGQKFQRGASNLGYRLGKFITDPLAPVHSSRHTFYSLSRRSGCESGVIEALTGHAKKEGLKVAQFYGDFSHDVLLREAQKVWDYVKEEIL